MDSLYKITFTVGVLYTFVSLLMSGISGALHLGSQIGRFEGHFGANHSGDTTHGHALATHVQGAQLDGHNSDASGNIHTGNHSWSAADTLLSVFSILINPIVAVSFLTVFGGIGIIATNKLRLVAIVIFLIALAAAILTSFLLYKFVAVPLFRSENSSEVSKNDLISNSAEVASAIAEDGFGQIKYTANSIRYTGPARQIEGKALKQGTKVAICKIEDNVFYVTEIEEL